MNTKINTGRFTSEKLKGNQYAKGNKPNKTSFKKGSHCLDKHPQWKGGVQLSKKDGYIKNLGNGKRISLARYNYEQVYGKIPNNYVVYHINGDNLDCRIENLEAISRKELLFRNRFKKL